MGTQLAQQIVQEQPISSDTRLQSRLQHVGKQIAAASDRPDLEYHFLVVDEDELNAFALPGGYVFVNRGLLDVATEDELAFVLGHEIGHITARHSLKRLQAALGVNLLVSLALGQQNAPVMRQAVGIVYQLISAGYSRKDEFLADELGVKYSYHAGFDPEAGITLMQKMERTGNQQHPFVFLSSHPQTQDRIANIRRAIGKYSS